MTTTTANTTTRFVFEIREQRYEEMVALFAKYLRRTRKTLTTPPTFDVIFERDEERTIRVPDRVLDPTGMLGEFTTETRWEHYLYVTVEGQIPQVDGWQFIATIDHSEGDNLIRSVPGVGNLPLEVRSALPVCHHCNTARRRVETFILRNAEGELKQVGRNCLADFFPHGVADAMANLEALAEAVAMASANDDEEGYGSRRGEEHFGLLSVLCRTEVAIDMFGWTSATKASESDAIATSQWVFKHFDKPDSYDSKELREFRATKATDKQVAEAEAALAWARDIDPENESDYLYNLRAACKGECFPSKRMGLVVSLIATYRRTMSRAEELERQAKNPSQHIGTVGKRDLFKSMTCIKRGVPTEGQYGPTTLLMFRDETGNTMKWFSSGNGEGWDEGTSYDLVATPKSHGEYRGQKETLVSRVAEWDGKWKAKK